jgi:hypothetical protein
MERLVDGKRRIADPSTPLFADPLVDTLEDFDGNHKKVMCATPMTTWLRGKLFQPQSTPVNSTPFRSVTNFS